MDIKERTILGCGPKMIRGMFGDFRVESVRGYAPLDHRSRSHVEYLFFCLLFIPVWPLGCYRVNDGTSCVMGEEKWKAGEIVRVYLTPVFAAVALASIMGGILVD
jgi:hypothetical protein